MDFWDDLASHGDHLALMTHDFSISYTELATRADAFRLEIEARLSTAITRPLIVLEAVNEPGAILIYLGALRAHWPVILVAEGSAGSESQIVQTYRPNIIFRRAADWQPVFAFTDPIKMHPDLAVLLSTSGTTGASKLVRLSRQNLTANAAAIAGYLQISNDDRAITLLPFHYSYGMSVLHTHLLRGAGLVLTEGSLIDPDLRALAARMGVNSLALVPTQFELLGDLTWLPRLRYITQAGGRLDPVLARHYSDKAAAEGWQLFIMYGQTEAAPRMSYVPPEDAQAWFHTIGRPLEGGRFRLLDSAGKEVLTTGTTAELVYEGPNVMLGYALTRADLGAPAGPCVLHTGDLAERLENGYFRITGRASRFIKIFGLRISLDEVETQLRAEGHPVYVTGSDAQLAVFVQDTCDLGPLQDHIAALYHLPQSVILVSSIKAAPLLPSGKVDYRALARQADALQPATQEAGSDTRAVLQQALRMPVLDLDRSFLELGGDSLAYLDLQLHLLTKLGAAPADWEALPLRTLLAQERPGRLASAGGRFSVQRVRADLLARVIAILSVVALHSTTWPTGGGSYLLLMMVGYSLARFQSHTLFEGNVLRTWRSMLVPILACYYLLISLISVLWHPISVPWFVLLGNFEEVISLKGLVPYWFVSTYTQIVLVFTLPFLVPSYRHQVARHPFAIGLLVLACVVLAMQFSAVADIASPIRHRHPLAAVELLLLGWCIFFTRNRTHKVMMTLVTLLVWWISWRDAPHSVDYMILCGALAMIWRLSVNLPTPLARGLMHIGSVTLFLYIVHVPVISLVTSLGLRSEILRFCVVTALSLVTAEAFKALYDWMDGRFASLGAAQS